MQYSDKFVYQVRKHRAMKGGKDPPNGKPRHVALGGDSSARTNIEHMPSGLLKYARTYNSRPNTSQCK